MTNAKYESKTQKTRFKRLLLSAALAIAAAPASFAAEPVTNQYVNNQVDANLPTAINQPGLNMPAADQPGAGSVRLNPAMLPKSLPVRLPTVAQTTAPAKKRPTRLPSVVGANRQVPQQPSGMAMPQHHAPTNHNNQGGVPNRSVSTNATSVAARSGQIALRNQSRQNAQLALRANNRTRVGPTGQPVRWLPSTTIASCQQEAVRSLQSAMHEYSIRAWASAEESAWQCLQHTAEGIDIAERSASFGANRGVHAAVDDLQMARTAIREARDFSGKYGTMDADAVKRVVVSHTTPVLHGLSLENTPAADATDRYFNEARVRLSRLAKYRPEAAQALDLIAAIYLGRGDKSLLPSQTALCLRRAALQGQPGNASLSNQLGMHLAALGLDAEAKWALEHTMSIQPNPGAAEMLQVVQQRAGDRAAAVRMTAQLRSRMPAGFNQNRGPVPAVVQLSPRDFAKVSPAVNTTSNQPAAQTPPPKPAPPIAASTAQVDSTTQIAPASHASNGADAPVQADLTNPAYYTNAIGKKSTVKRMIDSVKFWR